MNTEPSPYEPPRSNDPTDFRDRRTLLLVMGILLILGGLGCGCMGGFYGLAFPAMMSGEVEGMPQGDGFTKMTIGLGGYCLLMTVALVWLGIGSIRARKWARDLLYASGWAIGAFILMGAINNIFVLPKTIRASTQGASEVGTGVVILFVVIAFCICLIPAVLLIVIYGHRDVRHTVRRHDPTSPWTEALTTPAHVWWLFLIVGAVSAPVSALCYNDFLVASRIMPNRWLALAVPIVAGMVLGILACLLMKRHPVTWIASLALVVVGGALGLFLGRNADVMAGYEAWGVISSPEQAEMMRQIYADPMVIALPSLIGFVMVLGFLIVFRKHLQFRVSPDSPDVSNA